jgi:hypothetical protein
MAKRIITPRTPAADGPDVVFNGSDFDIYVDSRYLGSRANSQDAWIEARKTHFEGIEQAAVTTADIAAEVAEFVQQYATDNAPVSQRDRAIIRNLLIKPCFAEIEPGVEVVHYLHHEVLLTGEVNGLESEYLSLTINGRLHEYTRAELRTLRTILDSANALLDVA